MALTIGDAGDVQTLIRHLYGLPNLIGHLPDVDEVERAAHRLADRSSKVLMAGLASRDLLTRPLPGPEPIAPSTPGHAPGCATFGNVACAGCACICHQTPLPA